MKLLFISATLAPCLLLVVALGACSGAGSETRSKSSAVAKPSSLTAVASSADVVKIRTEDVAIPVGGNIDAKVGISISHGFHVNANPATFPYLIATEVTAGKIEGINVGASVYPTAEKKKFQFADQPLAVYEGDVQIKLDLRADKNAAAGSRSLPITVKVQACDEQQCYPPATLNAAISITTR